MTSTQLSRILGIPLRLIRDILFSLVKTNILIETITDSPRENGYQPSIDINRIDIKFVMDNLDSEGGNQVKIKESIGFDKLSVLYEKIIKSTKKSKYNLLLKDI